MKIYLSPSNQPNNLYPVGNTNEKVQMEKLASLIQAKLAKYEVESIMANLSSSIVVRQVEASNKKADFYAALHSNAGSPTAVGTVVFYHPDSALSKKVAEFVVKHLDDVFPFPENRYEQVISGIQPAKKINFHEVREPMKLGIPAILIEVNFHENPTVAQWMIDNMSKIADGVTAAFVEAFKLKLKEPSSKTVVRPVAPKVRLNKDTSLWAFDETKWGDIKSVKEFQKGALIDVAGVAVNPLGSTYYITPYSFERGIMHGFNAVDCEIIL